MGVLPSKADLPSVHGCCFNTEFVRDVSRRGDSIVEEYQNPLDNIISIDGCKEQVLDLLPIELPNESVFVRLFVTDWMLIKHFRCDRHPFH